MVIFRVLGTLVVPFSPVYLLDFLIKVEHEEKRFYWGS